MSAMRSLLYCALCKARLTLEDGPVCAPCLATVKTKKRRYHRTTAQRQLDGVMERVRLLNAEPKRCYWKPQAAILFGSMLSAAPTVGDIDFCVIGNPLNHLGLVSREEASRWRFAQKDLNDNSLDRGRQHYPQVYAQRFMRGRATILNMKIGYTARCVANITNGKPFDFRVLWCDPAYWTAEALSEAIIAARPQCMAELASETQFWEEHDREK